MDSDSLELLKQMDMILAYRKRNMHILANNKDKYINDGKDKFKFFNDKYPQIFEYILEGLIDTEEGKQQMLFMLSLQKKVESGEISHDNASKVIGERLAKEYVYPLVNDKDGNEKKNDK